MPLSAQTSRLSQALQDVASKAGAVLSGACTTDGGVITVNEADLYALSTAMNELALARLISGEAA